MYIVDEKDREYRFGDSGPKYLMKGPRMNFALVQFMPGQDFKAHYHNIMEENFLHSGGGRSTLSWTAWSTTCIPDR